MLCGSARTSTPADQAGALTCHRADVGDAPTPITEAACASVRWLRAIAGSHQLARNPCTRPGPGREPFRVACALLTRVDGTRVLRHESLPMRCWTWVEHRSGVVGLGCARRRDPGMPAVARSALGNAEGVS